jgi:hypothetical protein
MLHRLKLLKTQVIKWTMLRIRQVVASTERRLGRHRRSHSAFQIHSQNHSILHPNHSKSGKLIPAPQSAHPPTTHAQQALKPCGAPSVSSRSTRVAGSLIKRKIQEQEEAPNKKALAFPSRSGEFSLKDPTVPASLALEGVKVP